MIQTNKIIILIFFLLIFGCSKKDTKVIIVEETDIELQMIQSYNDGMKALERRDAIFAAKKFNEAELLYPQSLWAAKSALMAAYSYYSQNYYDDAFFELKRFQELYPNDLNIKYVHYLEAICYYETIIDEKKDLEPLMQAKKKFEFIIITYPNSDFALDAEYKLDLIQDILAAKEIYLGKHYIKKEKWVAAINRFKTVVNDYDTTVYVEEALHRLVEIHYRIGLIEESQKYANLLGYNYQSGKWYKESYKVFNKNYGKPIKKIKKDKISIRKKIKAIFD